ncbi:MAG: DUF4126 domain-containing protein [Myxococcales bacterium]|nr:DUF4126 domain-containing protein [Myxococcales bacterium]
MELLLGILVGVSLAAATGLRVFLPLLVAGIAARSGHLELAAGFDWMASTPALVAFGLASVLEVGAYHVPWLDHLLDTVSVPSAAVAGTLLTAAFVADVSPFLQATAAIVAGGGTAGSVALGTAGVRAVSTATTGGLANPIVAFGEAVASLVLSVVAVLAPVLALLVVLAGVAFGVRRLALRAPA